MDPLCFPEDVKALNTQSEVAQAMLELIAPYGYTTYAVGGLPHPDHPFPTAFMVHNWPEIWDKWYFERDFGPDDPVRAAALVTTEPLTIREIREGKAGFRPTAKGFEMLDAAAEIGRGDGLMVPVNGPNGYRGIVCFAGETADPGPKDRAILHLVAIYAHNRMRELNHRKDSGAADLPRLTPREAEVLRGARNGLDDERIAEWLGITVRTVRFHFDNAKQKLGARTRPEAVSMADNLHLLG